MKTFVPRRLRPTIASTNGHHPPASQKPTYRKTKKKPVVRSLENAAYPPGPTTTRKFANEHGPLHFRIANEFYDIGWGVPPLIWHLYGCLQRLANQRKGRRGRYTSLDVLAAMCSMNRTTVLDALAYLAAIRIVDVTTGKWLALVRIIPGGGRGRVNEYIVPALSAFFRAGGGSYQPLLEAIKEQNRKLYKSGYQSPHKTAMARELARLAIQTRHNGNGNSGRVQPFRTKQTAPATL